MIYVIGCNHGIQQERIEDAQVRTEQRAHFADFIEETISNGETQLVCEEWSDEAGTTIAHDLAGKHGVQWLNIGTTAQELKEIGIPTPFYARLPIRPERKAQWQRQREGFMLRRIKENRRGAENLLVVCGFDHMLPLSELLREEATEVKVIDYRKQDWYQPGVFFEDP